MRKTNAHLPVEVHVTSRIQVQPDVHATCLVHSLTGTKPEVLHTNSLLKAENQAPCLSHAYETMEATHYSLGQTPYTPTCESS
jgi:hypothetical protein